MSARNRTVEVRFTDLEDDHDMGLRTPEALGAWVKQRLEGLRDFRVEYIKVTDTHTVSIEFEEGRR